MVPCILPARLFKTNAAKPFDDLVQYIEGDKEQEQIQEQQDLTSQFDDIVSYATAPQDKKTKGEKCIAIRTHGLTGIETASREMNAVSKQNTRCVDPAYHILLSWPEHEHPAPETIFDAAEHALKALGLAEHQYVLAIHVNTDNIHCHISVNRIHPVTYRAHHIEWAYKTLHKAARESEMKHGWSHDNGLYIVEIDGHGKKQIIINPEFADSFGKNLPYAHRELLDEEPLPPWHDPDSLDSWLKSTVSRALKHALPDLTGWSALHAWLSNHDITLSDSGGGGMRLRATSPETGEILDLPASKGLRLLKRGELEKRWGKFANSVPVACIVPDLSHLTNKQLTKGVEHVLTRSFDHGIPPEHIIRAESNSRRNAASRTSGLHELPLGGVDADRPHRELLLQNALQDHLGNEQTGQDQDLRRPGASETSSGSKRSLTRDDSLREERKVQRAASRADLRQRFSQYMRFVRIGDTGHVMRVKAVKADRSQALKDIRGQTKAAKLEIRKNRALSISARLLANVEIDAESMRRQLQAEAAFQDKSQSLRATRLPPLSWRAWLYEQSNLGDQAALSALRGIVYQAQRDAKHGSIEADEIEAEEDSEEYRQQQYRKVMARLLEEEKKEVAIRSANSNYMRPFEADALLARYIGIQWRVTGNGNIEYSDQGGEHLFTDRGSRVTFDRVRVSDEEIRLALMHAQHKFGKQLTLTGDDPAFTKRMARLADDMGMTILNPELQPVIAEHRAARTLQIVEAITIAPAVKAPRISKMPVVQEPLVKEPEPAKPVEAEMIFEIPAIQTPHDRLRAMVLSIDPYAEFVIPDQADSKPLYNGPVAVNLESPDSGFAQHIGRRVYALHLTAPPERHNDGAIDVKYRNGQAVATVPDPGKGKGRSN